MKLEKIVYMQQWEEIEIGWGMRPDGCSFHLDRNDLSKYIDSYWGRMPDIIPKEYDQPIGTPVRVYVSDKLFDEVKESECGTRYYNYKNLLSNGEMKYLDPIVDGYVPLNFSK